MCRSYSLSFDNDKNNKSPDMRCFLTHWLMWRSFPFKYALFECDFMLNILSWAFPVKSTSNKCSKPSFIIVRIGSWRRHQMETFSALLAIVRGHRPPVNSPHKGHWRRAVIFLMICAWINGWVNNREAGDLRRHRTHYDVTVMWLVPPVANYSNSRYEQY